MARAKKAVEAEEVKVDEAVVETQPAEETKVEEVVAEPAKEEIKEEVVAEPAKVDEPAKVEEPVAEEPVKVEVKAAKKSETKIEEAPKAAPATKSNSQVVTNIAVYAAPNASAPVTLISGVVTVTNTTTQNGFVGVSFKIAGQGGTAHGFVKASALGL